MPKDTDVSQSNYITDRIRNQQAAGEGSVFPPRMRGGTRVPIVANFRVLRTEAFNGGTQVTVAWDNPSANATLPVGSFLISLKGISSGSANVSMTPVIALNSPAVLRVNATTTTVVIISIQTVLTSGQTSLIEESPTISVDTIAPVLASSDVESANLVLGYSDLNTVGAVTYVGATGTITTDPTNLFYDHTNKNLGVLTDSPRSTIHTAGSMGLKTSAQTTSYTAANIFCYFNDATAGNITITLPTASNVTDRFYLFKKTDSSTNTVAVGSAYTLKYQNESILICSNGTTWLPLIHSIL